MFLPCCSVRDSVFSPYRSPSPVHTPSQDKLIPSHPNNSSPSHAEELRLLKWAETKFLTKQAVQWDKLEAKCFTLGSPGQFTIQILYISLLPHQQPCSDTSHLPSPPLKAWTFPGPSQHMALHKGVPREDLALAMTNPPLLHYQSAALHPGPSTGLT